MSEERRAATSRESQDEWYARERAAFIAWWEAEGQVKFGANPTLAAGAGWLAKAEASLSSIAASDDPERSAACLRACDGLATVDVAGNKRGWLADLCYDAHKLDEPYKAGATRCLEIVKEMRASLVHTDGVDYGILSRMEYRLQKVVDTAVAPKPISASAPSSELAGASADVVAWLDSSEVKKTFQQMGSLTTTHPHLSVYVSPEFGAWASKVLARFRHAVAAADGSAKEKA